MLSALILLAQEVAKDKAGDGAGGSLLNQPMLPLLLMLGLFFFLIILPAQRREKRQREETMGKLKKNDEVVTSGGIIGTVHTIKDNADEVVLKIDDNARLRVLKSSIVRINTKEKDAPPDGAFKA